MYITTFYSFKGGVGRTMALANAAALLAMKGRNVLVVDFDIEAPGLDTFSIFKPKKDVYGLNDFVFQYLNEGSAPDVAKFVAECPSVGDAGGKLWIMPSSGSGPNSMKYNHVNWDELYERYDGYLLIEDLKEQWNQVLRPDYVLIDSRTGYTDTGGVCTRQLPDAVVVLFFPNEQNLRGLADIVADIRSEAASAHERNIDLHFVMSNVPDLDDDDEILEKKIAEFQSQLGFSSEPLIVHRYDSLSLLNQMVFAIDRPGSRLTGEYKQIVREIILRNWRDEDGALEYIKDAFGPRERDSIYMQEAMLVKIEREHSSNADVLFQLGKLKESRHDFKSALELISRAIEEGYEKPEAYISRSRIFESNQDLVSAFKDVRRVLQFERASLGVEREAILRYLNTGGSNYSEIVNSPLISSLSASSKFWLACELDSTQSELIVAISLFKDVIESDDIIDQQRVVAMCRLTSAYLGLGKFHEALQILEDISTDSGIQDFPEVNYAMAMWGKNGSADRDLFQRVIDLYSIEPPKIQIPADFQCLAISYWVVGSNDNALEYLSTAECLISETSFRSQFSCWRYLTVRRKSFLEDLTEIRTLIKKGMPLVPKFITSR